MRTPPPCMSSTGGYAVSINTFIVRISKRRDLPPRTLENWTFDARGPEAIAVWQPDTSEPRTRRLSEESRSHEFAAVRSDAAGSFRYSSRFSKRIEIDCAELCNQRNHRQTS